MVCYKIVIRKIILSRLAIFATPYNWKKEKYILHWSATLIAGKALCSTALQV